MLQNYCCKVCKSLLFRGSLEAFAQRSTLPTDDEGRAYIEIMCHERTCKHLNIFYVPTKDQVVMK